MQGTACWDALNDREGSTDASRLLSEWDNQAMDPAGAATDSFKLHSMRLRPLTQWKACATIPPLKASALWIADGLETEGTVSLMRVRSSGSLRSCSLATIHI
jgi:hypothetical protein